jgi:aminopeptidase-like protein
MIERAQKIEQYFDRLWPIARSIAGPGYKESLEILKEIIPFDYLSFKTGEQVFDWTVPQEWMARDAYIIDPNGQKRADFKASNIHLVNYSVPFTGRLGLTELKERLHSLPNQPNAIPYLTSYYKPYWGFCLTDKELQSLPDGEYEVVVDTELKNGELVVGEKVLPGKREKEILFSSYLCHPSLANNELSGPLVLSFLYQALAQKKDRKFTYRFVIFPETIGSISFLSRRADHLQKNLLAGYHLTCIGDGGSLTYKLSRQEDSFGDRQAVELVKEIGSYKIKPYDPSIGSDERHYCSPGFDLPVGSFMRTSYSDYPEYHTSLDDKSIISFAGMSETVDHLIRLVEKMEAREIYINKLPYGEPQLDKRGLFRFLSDKGRQEDELALWWLLNYSDGMHELTWIAAKSGNSLITLKKVAKVLEEAGLLEKI